MKRVQLKALLASAALLGLAPALTPALAAPGHPDHLAVNVSGGGLFVPAGQLANYPLDLSGNPVVQAAPGSTVYLLATYKAGGLALIPAPNSRELAARDSVQVQNGQLSPERLGTPDWLTAQLEGSSGWSGRVSRVVLSTNGINNRANLVLATYRVTVPQAAQPGRYDLQLKVHNNFGGPDATLPLQFEVLAR